MWDLFFLVPQFPHLQKRGGGDRSAYRMGLLQGFNEGVGVGSLQLQYHPAQPVNLSSLSGAAQESACDELGRRWQCGRGVDTVTRAPVQPPAEEIHAPNGRYCRYCYLKHNKSKRSS